MSTTPPEYICALCGQSIENPIYITTDVDYICLECKDDVLDEELIDLNEEFNEDEDSL